MIRIVVPLPIPSLKGKFARQIRLQNWHLNGDRVRSPIPSLYISSENHLQVLRGNTDAVIGNIKAEKNSH